MNITTLKDIKAFANSITLARFDESHKSAFLAAMKDKQLLIQHFVQAKHNKSLFALKVKDSSVVDMLDSIPHLKVGMLVTYINDFGVAFANNEILGFDADAETGERCVYLNTSSYWFAERAGSLVVQSGFIGLDDIDLASISPEYEESFMPWDLTILRMKEASN